MDFSTEQLKYEARFLNNLGYSYGHIGRELGKHSYTINRWCNKEAAQKNREQTLKADSQNREQKRLYAQQHRQANPEWKQQQNSEYAKANPAQFRERSARRRALMRDFDFWSEDVLKEMQSIYDNCPDGFHVDHIQPLSRGGIHHPVNLQYLPVVLNLQKGNQFSLDDQALLCKRYFMNDAATC